MEPLIPPRPLGLSISPGREVSHRHATSSLADRASRIKCVVRGVHAAILLAGMSLHAIAADRSPTLRAEFMRQNPCPATGSTRGACPGYQVDHREALICGGRDELQNLQWLSVAEHKAKTRVEVKLCRPRVR